MRKNYRKAPSDKREPRTDLDLAHRRATALDREDTLSVRLLSDLPIDDPFKEKRLIEEGGPGALYEYLRKKHASPVWIPPEKEPERIREIYRLCFARARGREWYSILRDFAAHCPRLAWRERSDLSQWQNDSSPDPADKMEALLTSLAEPFTPQERRAMKIVWLSLAPSVQQRLNQELKAFVVELSAVEPGRIEEKISEKMQDLENRFPALSEVREGMRRHLVDRHADDASVLAAAKICVTGSVERPLRVRNSPNQTVHFTERERRIWEIIRRRVRGLQYCRELDNAGIAPLRTGVWKDCPRKYASAYLEGEPWRHRIQDEKSKIRRKAELAKQLAGE
jgi:AcrR family transcriptional regulator